MHADPCYCRYVLVGRHDMGMLPHYLLNAMIALKRGDHAAAIEMICDTISLAEQMTRTVEMLKNVLPADPLAADQRAVEAIWHAANGPASEQAP